MKNFLTTIALLFFCSNIYAMGAARFNQETWQGHYTKTSGEALGQANDNIYFSCPSNIFFKLLEIDDVASLFVLDESTNKEVMINFPEINKGYTKPRYMDASRYYFHYFAAQTTANHNSISYSEDLYGDDLGWPGSPRYDDRRSILFYEARIRNDELIFTLEYDVGRVFKRHHKSTCRYILK